MPNLLVKSRGSSISSYNTVKLIAYRIEFILKIIMRKLGRIQSFLIYFRYSYNLFFCVIIGI